MENKRAGETYKESLDLHPKGYKKGPNPYKKRSNNVSMRPTRTNLREDTERSNHNNSFLEKSIIDETLRNEASFDHPIDVGGFDTGSNSLFSQQAAHMASHYQDDG